MRKVLAVIAALLTTSWSLAKGDNTTDAFKGVLGSKGYFMADPAEDWAYAGGFLVVDKDQATFHDLPKAVSKPKPKSFTASFSAVDKSKKFNLTAVLTGLSAIIGGDPGAGFGSTSSLNLSQLNAQASRIESDDAENLLKVDKIKSDVLEWIKSGHSVYVIGIVLSTKNISLTTNGTGHFDLSFNGSPVSACGSSSNGADNTKSGAQKSQSQKPQTPKGQSSAQPSSSSTNSSNAAASGKPPSATGQTATGSTSNKPGGAQWPRISKRLINPFSIRNM